jgi:DNA polymerase IV (DinB-like DNA polymerase)
VFRYGKNVNRYEAVLSHGGPSLHGRTVMLVDLDYFFAQAEEKRHLAIRDKPVVVCVYSGRSKDSGAVSTANYVARRLGVHSGMPIALAKRKLQNIEAVFLPVDYAFYEEISERIMNVLKTYADTFEQVGIDEAYLDISQRTKGNYEEAAELAQSIKKEIELQHGLTCSIGIGPNKLIAKIAADTNKPNGVTIVTPDKVTEFLSPLPVDRLLGVGAKTREKMRALEIATIGDLAKCNVQRLVDVFGKKLGTYFHDASAGIDDEPVRERGEAESISRISTLKEDTRELRLILERTDKQCEEIHADLERSGFNFKTVTIMAVMKDMSIRSRSGSLENRTDKLETLKETVRELLERFLTESDLDVRRVGVKVSSLSRGEKSQRQLTNFIEQAQK